MRDKPLSGLHVLLVEDDYYLAADAGEAIESAGGEVLGPFATEQEARTTLDRERVDVAVLDINLGQGPTFELAHDLQLRHVPFVFATGYDREALPEDLRGFARLEKPYRPVDLIACLAERSGVRTAEARSPPAAAPPRARS